MATSINLKFQKCKLITFDVLASLCFKELLNLNLERSWPLKEVGRVAKVGVASPKNLYPSSQQRKFSPELENPTFLPVQVI